LVGFKELVPYLLVMFPKKFNLGQVLFLSCIPIVCSYIFFSTCGLSVPIVD
jgi:hypothetical protein